MSRHVPRHTFQCPPPPPPPPLRVMVAQPAQPAQVIGLINYGNLRFLNYGP